MNDSKQEPERVKLILVGHGGANPPALLLGGVTTRVYLTASTVATPVRRGVEWTVKS